MKYFLKTLFLSFLCFTYLSASSEEKENINQDPLKNYKLVGIYVIENKPIAIIKNLLNVSNTKEEYEVGDYLDEMQTISVSKISLTPTSRVELIDNDGVTYLMKPYVAGSESMASTSTKFAPTYTNKKYKSKFKLGSKTKNNNSSQDKPKEPSKSSDGQPAQPPPDSKPPDQAMVDAAQSGTAGQPTQAPDASMSQPAQAPDAQMTQPAEQPGNPPPQPPPDSLDRERPANPFGE